jgi:hypothetical protein
MIKWCEKYPIYKTYDNFPTVKYKICLKNRYGFFWYLCRIYPITRTTPIRRMNSYLFKFNTLNNYWSNTKMYEETGLFPKLEVVDLNISSVPTNNNDDWYSWKMIQEEQDEKKLRIFSIFLKCSDGIVLHNRTARFSKSKFCSCLRTLY